MRQAATWIICATVVVSVVWGVEQNRKGIDRRTEGETSTLREQLSELKTELGQREAELASLKLRCR